MTEAAAENTVRCSYQQLVPIAEIRPNPANPNQHTPQQIAAFAAILRYQGTRRAFRVSRQSGLLVVGHGMLEAYKLNGWTECPVDTQDYASPAQEFADMVADNALSTWSQLDMSAVSETARQLALDNFDVSMLGIDGLNMEPLDITYPEVRRANERTKDEKATEYMASQSRNMVLVYSLIEFNEITGMLGSIMAAEGQETFSDVVKFLAKNYADSLPKAPGN